MTMAQATDYRKRAEECVQLAQTVRSPQQRTMLLHIAETWLRLAQDVSFDVLHEPREPREPREPTSALN
jgi:hypothetical protein